MRVRERIAAACVRTGRQPAAITLIGASKTVPVAAVAAAWEAGVRDFGENRVQEGMAHRHALEAQGIRPTWHLIGHLQSNKTALALRTFDLIHAVDSARLVDEIARRAQAPVHIMIEVNVSHEPGKYGVFLEAAPPLIEHARAARNVILEGLMTVAPHTNDEGVLRTVFRTLASLASEHSLQALSMGMSNDFELAVEEGATHLRLGQAIFGARS